ncbi:MAG: 2-C-methyl-D-erythritol 2,4-cyclodiphosphate synthase [Candidatus Margulisiibacteriota bacterium]
MRIGIGWDVHKLVRGRKLILGGINIPFKKGLAGYSDADVLVHAIIDSILGAAAAGDIGSHFPTGNPKYKDISSIKLLEKVAALIKQKKYKIVNIDSTVIAQEPRLTPYTDIMAAAIAKTLKLSPSSVNVKAKTQDKLGYIGRGKAISAQAVCLVQSTN